MVIDYFTKWVEAEALASITPVKIREFVYKNILFRYDCEELKEFCDDLQIKKVFTSVV